MSGSSRGIPLPEDSKPRWILLIALVVLSVQWGRGVWLPNIWLKRVRSAVAIIAAVAFPFVMAATLSIVGHLAAAQQSAGLPEFGLWHGGQRVTNIFAYDAAGTPIDTVQLFDQSGAPLLTVDAATQDGMYDYQTDAFGNEIYLVPVPGSLPGTGWNIYPLYMGRPPMPGAELPTEVTRVNPPFARVPSVPGYAAPEADEKEPEANGASSIQK